MFTHIVYLGWSYIFYPTTDIYNMSYPKLVTLLRQGLRSLYKSAVKLERQWLIEALLTQPLSHIKRHHRDPSRKNKDTLDKPTKPAIEPLTQGHHIKTEASPDSTYNVVEEPHKSDPKRVRQIKSPTAVKPELWETQLRSGLTIMQQRLGKR